MRFLFLRFSLLLALAPFVLLMAFNQPFFDDFRLAHWTRDYGFWGMQKWFYLYQSGRFTSTVFMTALNPVTYGWLEGVKIVAAVIFVLQWASIAFFLRTLFHLALRMTCSWSTACWTAGLLLTLACNAVPSPFSFLYWFCAIIAYQVPLIGLLNFAALAMRAAWGPARLQWRCAVLACGALVLALAGNELSLVQTWPTLALIAYLLPAAARPKLWLWLTVAVLATAATAAAPGNWLRVMASAPPTDSLHAYRWLVLLPRTAYSLALFLIQPMIWLSLLAAMASGLWLGYQHRTVITAARVTRPQWLVISLAFILLNSISFLLFRYIFVGAPLLRAQNEILLVMLISVAALAWVAAQQLPAVGAWKPRLLRNGRLLALLLVGLFGAGNVPEAWGELLTSAAAYNVQMQARFAALRAAHRAHASVVLPPLRLPQGRILSPVRKPGNRIEFDVDLTTGCEGHINGVMQRYFGVANVCCSPTAPALPEQP